MSRRYLGWMVLPLLLWILGLLPSKDALARPALEQEGVTPAQVVEAVNNLRLAYGLLPLRADPILTEIAQNQANALAATEGSVGHARPDGMTLGQQMILMGYPLSGDLTLDGYRSENWVMASTADEAISAWLGDEPHTNTMLSQNRSDIGAGVAIGDQTYIVIDTALRTSSGLPQSEAYDILTGIPLTQAAYSGVGTEAAAQGLLPEYIIPVLRNTARPDGDVFHKVQYGQTLWSIAVTYGTTINMIRAWNNLGQDATIYEGQLLLVQKGATQPPPATQTSLPSRTPLMTGTPTPLTMLPGFPTMTLHPPQTAVPEESGSSTAPSLGFWVGLIVFVTAAAAFVAAWFIRPPK